jgi:hypothetical protein
MKVLPGAPDRCVACLPVVSAGALLQLRAGVRRRRGISVPDWLMTHMTSKRSASSAIEM